MAQGSGVVLPRLDGVAVEHRVAGEDQRAILLARTLTELKIAEPVIGSRAPLSMCCLP
jgi:hypothetical protein